jgi:cytochrome c553
MTRRKGRFARRGPGLWPALALLFAAPAAAAHPAPASIAHGEWLATTLGCRSCHTPALTGKAMIDDPTIGTLYSANLSRAVPRYSDRQLDAVIRSGMRPDGSHLWMMAAAPYAVLTPADMRDLIAYLRQVPPAGPDHPRLHMGPRLLRAVKAGRLHPEGLDVPAALAHPAPDLGPALARGRYLARTACGGCHGPDLSGLKDPQPGDPPNLVVAAAYGHDAFRAMMRTGKGLGGRDLGDMSDAARERFAHMRDDDLDAIHAYLVARAKR